MDEVTRAERHVADMLARATQLAIAGERARDVAEALDFPNAEALLDFLRARRYVGTAARLETNTGAPPSLDILREDTRAHATTAARHARADTPRRSSRRGRG